MQAFLGILVVVGVIVGGMWFFSADKSPKTDTISAVITPRPSLEATDDKNMQRFDKLMIEDTKVGAGVAVKSGDTISIHYLGTLTDGTKFDSSYDRGAPFETQIGVGRVIKGWDEGVIGMKVGGKRTLKIPSELGYGMRGAGASIPPNADLIFEVELVGIK